MQERKKRRMFTEEQYDAENQRYFVDLDPSSQGRYLIKPQAGIRNKLTNEDSTLIQASFYRNF